MEIKVKLFANLRDRVTPKPPIGEPITVEIENNGTISDLLEKLDFPEDDVSIIFINGVHKDRDFVLTDGTTVSMFPPSGGG